MRSNQKGFSLIEILISLAVFSVILLSLSYTQLQNTQVMGEQYLEQVALNLIHNAYEQCQVSCVEANVQLNKAVETQLPEGRGSIMDMPEQLLIRIAWLNRFSSDKTRELQIDV